MPTQTPNPLQSAFFFKELVNAASPRSHVLGISPSTRRNGLGLQQEPARGCNPTWVCEGAPPQPPHTHRVPPMPLASLRYSVWCLVATKTTVWSWGFTTLRSRWSSTAGLSSPRTWKKASCRGRAALSPSGAPRSWGGPTLLGTPHSALPAPHPEHKAWIKLTLSCSLSLDSTSRRISVGSVRPAGHGHAEDAGGVGTRCWDSPQLLPSLRHPLGPASTQFGFSSPGPVASTAEGLGHVPIPDSS